MKQILQSLKNGHTQIADIPMPQIKDQHVLIQTQCSLISPGTEKMLVQFGESSLLTKARQQPDKVRMVINKIKADGLWPTFTAVRHKLDQLIPMGYSNVGRVIAVGKGVNELTIGDRVVSNGAHAEIVSVTKNLCCKIPESVSDDEAAFTVLGAIAMQGVRLSAPQLGESFVVIGLGLIGLLTLQILKANGCRVLGIDLDCEKTQLAHSLGAEVIDRTDNQNIIAEAHRFSRGRGVDGVIMTCATASNEPMHEAAQMCRKKGRITVVGVTGLQLSRADFYAKELNFQVSCAYGPGRYDSQYESEGQDYPLPYVRFTAQRNFEAFLDLLAMRAINIAPLITARYPIDQAEEAYASLSEASHLIGILLDYPTRHVDVLHARTVNFIHEQYAIDTRTHTGNNTAATIAFIGAGNYASRVLIPAFKQTQARLLAVACENGMSGVQIAKRLNINTVTTDTDAIFANNDINTVVIATRHNTHAELVVRALHAGNHVFVEKPLCLTLEELNTIEKATADHSTLLMVGFNRRFAPQIQRIKTLLRPLSQPKVLIMTVNAGEIPRDHWTQQRDIGGGRLIGEACHFIDLLRYVVGAPITHFNCTAMKNVQISSDQVSMTLSFADGSLGTILYLANGHSSFPKERLEVFCQGTILQLDNFRQLYGYGFRGFKRQHLWRQDKGQQACVQAFVEAIEKGLPPPIPIDEIVEVAKVTIALAQQV